jgi:hypothetical protein
MKKSEGGMMELNKYDLVELLAKNLSDISCYDCPIKKECNERKYGVYICFDEDKTKKLLMKKYNL